jgi:DNA gyrase subunit A
MGIRNAYSDRSRLRRHARQGDVEEVRKDREALIITEIPYQVNKASMIEKIAELVRDKRIEGISDIRDESDRDGMRVVIELKRDAWPTSCSTSSTVLRSCNRRLAQHGGAQRRQARA